MAPSGMAPMSSWNVWPNGIECGRSRRGRPVEFSLLGWAGWAKARGFVCCGEGFIISPSGWGHHTQPALPQTPGPPFDDVPIPVSE